MRSLLKSMYMLIMKPKNISNTLLVMSRVVDISCGSDDVTHSITVMAIEFQSNCRWVSISSSRSYFSTSFAAVSYSSLPSMGSILLSDCSATVNCGSTTNISVSTNANSSM